MDLRGQPPHYAHATQILPTAVLSGKSGTGSRTVQVAGKNMRQRCNLPTQPDTVAPLSDFSWPEVCLSAHKILDATRVLSTCASYTFLDRQYLIKQSGRIFCVRLMLHIVGKYIHTKRIFIARFCANFAFCSLDFQAAQNGITLREPDNIISQCYFPRGSTRTSSSKTNEWTANVADGDGKSSLSCNESTSASSRTPSDSSKIVCQQPAMGVLFL